LLPLLSVAAKLTLRPMARHGAPPPSGRAILQPVLTYAPETNCKGSTPASKTGWCISSWCCSGLRIGASPSVMGLKIGIFCSVL
jgi:hypothetical protein